MSKCSPTVQLDVVTTNSIAVSLSTTQLGGASWQID